MILTVDKHFYGIDIVLPMDRSKPGRCLYIYLHPIASGYLQSYVKPKLKIEGKIKSVVPGVKASMFNAECT